MAKTKSKPRTADAVSEQPQKIPGWRGLSIDDLEYEDDNAPIHAAIVNANFTTLGDVEAHLRKYEGKPVLGLTPNETNRLVDDINLVAEDDDGFEEIAYVKEDAKADVDAEDGDEVEDTEVDDEDDEAPVDPTPAVDSQPVYDPTTPKGLIQYDRQTVELVSAKSSYADACERDYNSAHKVAQAKKKTSEAADAALRSLIRDRAENRTKKPQPKQKSLLDLKPEAEPESDLWKQYPITAERWERFGLTARDCELMNGGEVKGNSPAFPITTFGDVACFCQPNPNNPSYNRSLADLKGFGEAAVDRFAAAQEKFFAWWEEKGEAEFRIEMKLPEVAEKLEEKLNEKGLNATVEVGEGEEEEGPEFATVDDYLKHFLRDFAERKNLAAGATDKQIGEAIEFMYGDHGGRSGPGYYHERRKGTWTLEVSGMKEALKGKKLIDRVRTICNIPQLAN